MAPGHDLLNDFLVTLEHCLDTAVGQIAHPARYTAHVGLALGLVTKEDALHMAADYDVNPNVGHEGLNQWAGGSSRYSVTMTVFGMAGTLVNTFVPRSRVGVKRLFPVPRQFQL